MRFILAAIGIALSTISVLAQNSSETSPQSARQALIEMFMGKRDDDLSRHLPDDARKALVRNGETRDISVALRIATLGREMAAQGRHIETFEIGPNILITEDPNNHERVEVAVDSDSLAGEEDEIELSVHIYKDGQPQWLPLLPSISFRLKQENDVWKLIEVVASAHIPLTDPDYLKGLRREQDNSNESGARVRMSMIAEAETRYAANHNESGFTCSLEVLFASPAEPTGQGYYSPGSSSEELNAYHFALSGCQGTPVSKYRILAVPIDRESEMKVYCTEESGVLKSIGRDQQSSCFSRGEVETPTGSYAPTTD